MHYTKAVLHGVFYDGDVMTQEGDTGMNVLASAGKKTRRVNGCKVPSRRFCTRACVRARACVCYFICKLMSSILPNSSLFREYLNATGLRCHDFSCGMHDIWVFL